MSDKQEKSGLIHNRKPSVTRTGGLKTNEMVFIQRAGANPDSKSNFTICSTRSFLQFLELNHEFRE
jgi:hypothetical protein